MTTNAADKVILDFARSHDAYTADRLELEEIQLEIEHQVRTVLQRIKPFDGAFIGRIGRVVPFLPMANDTEELDESPLRGEMMTVAKIMIERQQELLSLGSDDAGIEQLISPETKHSMAKIVVRDAIAEAGVRGIQKGVGAKMGDMVLHTHLLERGGIKSGSSVRYSAHESEKKIQFRVLHSDECRDDKGDEQDDTWAGDEDLFG